MFIVFKSLAAALVKGLTDCHHLLTIPFIRVLIINFNYGEGISKQNKQDNATV